MQYSLQADVKLTSGVRSHRTTSNTAVASATHPPLTRPEIPLLGPAANIADAIATQTPATIRLAQIIDLVGAP